MVGSTGIESRLVKLGVTSKTRPVPLPVNCYLKLQNSADVIRRTSMAGFQHFYPISNPIHVAEGLTRFDWSRSLLELHQLLRV
jgi:hypothetical protein